MGEKLVTLLCLYEEKSHHILVSLPHSSPMGHVVWFHVI